MVIAVHFLDPRANRGQGRTHRQPHQLLHAVHADFLHQLQRAELGGPVGVADQAVHELQVKRLFDEARRFAVQLVTQATRCAHHHFFAAVPSRNRFANGLAQSIDALGGWQRELHRIDVDRHEGHRRLAFGPEQFERQGAGVVHQYFLASHDVKVFGNQCVDDLPGQIDLALEGRQCGDGSPFVGVVVLGRRAHGKGGHRASFSRVGARICRSARLHLENGPADHRSGPPGTAPHAGTGQLQSACILPGHADVHDLASTPSTRSSAPLARALLAQLCSETLGDTH